MTDRTVFLTNGTPCVLDESDAHLFDTYNWYEGLNGRTSYARTRIAGRFEALHRVIMDAPDGVLVDHKNGNGLDNRRSNLRFATQTQNQQNSQRPTHNRSGYKGVYFDSERGKYRAEVNHNGARKRIGRFDTAEEAARAYNAAASVLHGEFARLNNV